MKSRVLIGLMVCLAASSLQTSRADSCPASQTGTFPLSGSQLETAGNAVGASQAITGVKQPWYEIRIRFANDPGKGVLTTHVAFAPDQPTSQKDAEQAYALYGRAIGNGPGTARDFTEFKELIRKEAPEMSFNSKLAFLTLYMDRVGRITNPELTYPQPGNDRIFQQVKQRGTFPIVKRMQPMIAELARALGLTPVKSQDSAEMIRFEDPKDHKIVVISSNRAHYLAPAETVPSRALVFSSKGALGGQKWRDEEVTGGKTESFGHFDASVMDSARPPTPAGALKTLNIAGPKGTGVTVIHANPDDVTAPAAGRLQQVTVATPNLDKSFDVGPLSIDLSTQSSFGHTVIGNAASSSRDIGSSVQVSKGPISETVETSGDNSAANPVQFLSLTHELGSDDRGIHVRHVFRAVGDEDDPTGLVDTEFGVHHKQKLGKKVELHEETNLFIMSAKRGGSLGYFGNSGITYKSGKLGQVSAGANYGLDPSAISPVDAPPPSSLGAQLDWKKAWDRGISARELDLQVQYRKPDGNLQLMNDPTFGPSYQDTPRWRLGAKLSW